MSGLSLSDMKIITDVLKAYPNIEEAILFGSRAKGTQNPGSDVDIAIKGFEVELLTAQVRGELNDESPLPYTFDIVALDTLENKALREHIQRVGISFYIRE
jgi:uncharacterized protein